MSLEALLVDDNKDPDKNRWAKLFRGAGHGVVGILGADDPVSAYRNRFPSIGFIAPLNSKMTMLKALHKLKIVHPDIPVIAVTEYPEFFSTAMCGPFRRVTCLGLKEAQTYLAEGLTGALGSDAGGCSMGPVEARLPVIIGVSRGIQEIRRKIRAVAGRSVTVLITGESGTGKELVARSIYCHSDRSGTPLVKVNCGALPETLLESEVFGYQRGAFTGAHADKPGRLEMAHHGTLFIDEIGVLPLSLQVKFLQVLEDKVFSRLGGVSDHQIETRVIAATNSDLVKLVREGLFRKDLYFRLAVMQVDIPPLRDRREDIALLTHYFLTKYSVELNREILDMPEEAINWLNRYSWPGNVRELENLVRRVVVMQDWGLLTGLVVPESCVEAGGPRDTQSPEVSPPLWSDEAIKAFLAGKDGSLKKLVKTYTEASEREVIEQALKQVRWNRKQAAELLGVSYKTLLNRIDSLKLSDDDG